MKTEDILSHVDHTLLKAAASWEEIRKLCDEAMEYRTASVCVPSCYVKKIRENYPRLTICTVVGFPYSYRLRKYFRRHRCFHTSCVGAGKSRKEFIKEQL